MNTIAISRPDITQTYNLRANNVQETTKNGKLDDNDRFLSNVAGVIAGIVAGIFATIGGFFLLGIFGGEFMSVGATLGGSLLCGAGGVVGGFFIIKYAMQALIKSGGNGGGHSVGDHHTFKPVKTHSTKQPTVSPSKIDFCKKQFEEFGKKYLTAPKGLQKAVMENHQFIVDQIKDSLEQSKISKEMANDLLEDCKDTHICIANLMKTLGNSISTPLTQFAKIMSLPTIIKEIYLQAHNQLSKIILEGVASQKELQKKQQEQLKEGGVKWKQKYPDENFSILVDTMVEKMLVNYETVIEYYAWISFKLINISEGFLNCL